MEQQINYTKTKEAILLKEIIKEYKIPALLSYSDLRAYFIRKGNSATTTFNYIFALQSYEIINRNNREIIIQKKFYESALHDE